MKTNIHDDMNKNEINYKELLEKNNYILIDVRTPKEYQESTIPGTINIPVLLDEERVMVGTAYKKESQEKAKQLGIEAISKRLGDITKQINKLSKEYDTIIFFCARGGMRSGSMTSFFKSMGYKTARLSGGYKSYRAFIMEDFESIVQEITLIILHGKTGTGKTKILNELHKRDVETIDLEGLAKNRGSHFGHIGIPQDRSQKTFESLLYDAVKHRKNNVITIEGESRKIGPIHIPDPFWDTMKVGMKILVEAPIEMRLDIIMDDYTGIDQLKENLLEVAEKLKRYMDGSAHSKFIDLVEKGKIREAARQMMIEYYDPMYNKSLNKHSYHSEVMIESIEDGVVKLKEIFKKYK
ncbi:tRNA 2-selenouridine(34) synthase MnmH [Psychrilyobacter sp.]|uniref:tRNA 2-selenouridine(34) synthase MnmH n=1 Tax=Psychrilyobacter sp. TaxID=2586924 RepID=UPI0030161CE0